MKKQFLLFSFIFSFFCLNAQILQQKIFIDFGPNGTGTGNYLNGVITPSPDANLNYWNNAINPVAPASLSLVNSSNVSTGFNMAVTTTMNLNGLAANGGLASPSATSLGDLAIGTATQDFFFTNNATSPGALKFTNLNPAKGYKF